MIGYTSFTPEVAQKAQDEFVTTAARTGDALAGIAKRFAALSLAAADLLAKATFLQHSVLARDTELPKPMLAPDCTEWQCAYKPYRDSFCVDMQSGFAWWVLGSVLFVLSLLLMTVRVCLRRRDMRPIAIEAVDEDDDPNPELARFAVGKFL
jgi:hypothetical protein